MILKACNINPRPLNELPHIQNYLIYRIWWRFAYKIENAGFLMGCSRARANQIDFSIIISYQPTKDNQPLPSLTTSPSSNYFKNNLRYKLYYLFLLYII